MCAIEYSIEVKAIARIVQVDLLIPCSDEAQPVKRVRTDVTLL